MMMVETVSYVVRFEFITLILTQTDTHTHALNARNNGSRTKALLKEGKTICVLNTK